MPRESARVGTPPGTECSPCPPSTDEEAARLLLKSQSRFEKDPDNHLSHLCPSEATGADSTDPDTQQRIENWKLKSGYICMYN